MASHVGCDTVENVTRPGWAIPRGQKGGRWLPGALQGNGRQLLMGRFFCCDGNALELDSGDSCMMP